jgi:hypothetical protein
MNAMAAPSRHPDPGSSGQYAQQEHHQSLFVDGWQLLLKQQE